MPTWSSLYGLAADNVIRYEVVLANSTIVNASASAYSDLFWALKGGGSNFGIVTEFELKTVDLSLVYYEALLYNITYTPQLFEAIIKFQAAAEKDSNATIICNWTLGEVLVGLAYAQPIFRPAVFTDFYAIPKITNYINGTVSTPTEMALAYSNIQPTTPGRRQFFAVSHKTSLDVYQAVYNNFLEIAPQANASFGAALSWGIQPWTSQASRHGLDKNPLGLTPVSQNWMSGVIEWYDPAADQKAYDTINILQKTSKEASVKVDKDLDFIFMNDANYGQNVLRGYGEENLARLKQISKKYDPTQLFQRQQEQGFLLSKA
jgi:hypothetical protein